MKKILFALAIMLGLSASAKAEEIMWRGFYADGFVGVGLFDSTQTVGGVKLIDQGGDYLSYGARAGYGWRFLQGLYLGGEAELWGTNGGRSRAVVNGDVYNYSINIGGGAFARFGYSPQNTRALFYTRLGMQFRDTNQGTDYPFAVGLGAEVPVSNGYLRVDFTYSKASGVELYQTTAGFGWRF